MNRTEINPSALYWASFNRFELRLPGQAVLECAHSGDCEADCRRWAPRIRDQVTADSFPNGPDPDKIRMELKEYGAWDSDELADDEMNWIRLVWIAANNIREEDEPDCSEPVRNAGDATP